MKVYGILGGGYEPAIEDVRLFRTKAQAEEVAITRLKELHYERQKRKDLPPISLEKWLKTNLEAHFAIEIAEIEIED